MVLKLRKTSSEKAKKYFSNKMAFTTGPAELKHLLEKGEAPVIIDVRRPEDYLEGHIPGAINVPREEWNSSQALVKNKTNVLYCYTHVCHLATEAALHFASLGYPVVELEGGFDYWKHYQYDIEKGKAREPVAA